MRAIVISRYGDESVLEVVEQPAPEPQDGEVLVEIRAAGINPVDWKAREGALAPVTDRHFPLGLGWDIAGVAVPAAAIAPMPAKLSFEQAAGVPLAALTAWQALDAADVRAGQRVLVQGGAGGVGHFAVQLARVRGAHVLATSSSRNLDFMRELGVHEPLDYTAGHQHDVEPVGVVIDAVGGQVQRDSGPRLPPAPAARRAGQLLHALHATGQTLAGASQTRAFSLHPDQRLTGPKKRLCGRS